MNRVTLEQTLELLLHDEVVAIPTETVYGLAANAESPIAVEKVYTYKHRPRRHPLIVHIASQAMVPMWTDHLPDYAYPLMDAFWPGPLTLIYSKKAGKADSCCAGQDSIALRCPDHPLTLQVLNLAIGLQIYGLAAPSANIYGHISPTQATHVDKEFNGQIPVLDGGACRVGIESTILDCRQEVPIILRPGMLSQADLSPIQPVVTPQEYNTQSARPYASPKTSGSDSVHYAPRVPFKIVNLSELSHHLAHIPATLKLGLWLRTPLNLPNQAVMVRYQASNAADFAKQMFAQLHEFEDAQVDEIWLEAVPSHPSWDSIQDRLRRASAFKSHP